MTCPYYQDRACSAPAAAWVFELLEPLGATAILHGDEPLVLRVPEPDPLQRRILSLLKVPSRAYQLT